MNKAFIVAFLFISVSIFKATAEVNTTQKIAAQSALSGVTELNIHSELQVGVISMK